jgi:hypothetical protein
MIFLFLESYFSMENVKEGMKGLLKGWSLTSPEHPTVLSYLKSKQFSSRMFFSFLYSLIVSTALLFILNPPLAEKFYAGFPFSILTTAIFVYSSPGSAVHLIKVRIGGFFSFLKYLNIKNLKYYLKGTVIGKIFIFFIFLFHF